MAVTPHARDTMLLTPGDDQAADFDGPRADARRLAVARATGLLGPEPDPELDRYGQLARRVLNVAACYISITDDTHVFVKSAVECAAASTPPLLEPAKSHISCAYVAVTGKPLAVADLREDPRFRQHALDATPHLPAYLGVPLFVRGQSIGAICALDDKVRQWLPSEVELLGELASAVGKLIEVTSSAALSRLALVDTQVRYRSLTDDAPLVAFQALDDGSVVYVNRYTEEYLGQPRERLCSLGWLDFVPADGRAQALRQWQDMVATEKPGGFELPIRCADGVYRTLHVRAQPVRDHANRIEHWVGIALDIEERKQAEAQFRTSQDRFWLALEAGKLGFWDWNVVTNDAIFDGHWAQILGYEQHEIAPKLDTWLKLVHPKDMPSVRAALNAHLDGETEYYESEHRLRHRDGSWRWVLDRGRVVERAPDGTPLRALGTHADITARKEAEQALQLSEGRLQLAMEIAAVATWDADLVNGTTLWSKSLSTLFGIEGGAPSPTTLWREVVPAADRERLFAEWARAEREQDVFRCEHRLLRPDDGRQLWIDVAGRFFFDTHGRAERFVGVCVDVTERKQAEAVLQESARNKDDFLAMLAHELRNPLAPIANAAEILRGAAALDPTVDRARAMIERQVKQLVHLVDDLLDVSRVSRGRIVLQKSAINLSDVVLQAVETCRPQVDARAHQLHVSLPERPLMVDGDFTRLTQVVSNLLNNAAKYTDEGGRIEVALESRPGATDDVAVLRVRDNGRGIDAHALNQIFELFFQANNSLDRAEGGLGIGLSLVKRLVENHGGKVTVHSAGRGQGSEFTVRLPLLKQQALPASRATPPKSPPAPQISTRILLVDDNRDATDSLALLLQMHGHDVLSAYEGRSALDLAAREQPSFILVDIGLPDIDGFEVARRLRANPRTAGSVLVALTGYGQPADREKSKHAGFDHHLVKPAGAQEILSLVGG